MKTVTYIDSNEITHEKQYDDNIVFIHLSCKKITELKGLDTLVNLQTLSLYHNKIT